MKVTPQGAFAPQPATPATGPDDAGPHARHLLAEYYGCSRAVLDDLDLLGEVLRGAAEAARTTLVELHLHKFAPQGVSGMAVLAESHLAIHTWPEHGFAAVEVFVCGAEADPEAGHAYLVEHLRPRHTEFRQVRRGRPELVRRFPAPPPAAGE